MKVAFLPQNPYIRPIGVLTIDNERRKMSYAVAPHLGSVINPPVRVVVLRNGSLMLGSGNSYEGYIRVGDIRDGWKTKHMMSAVLDTALTNLVETGGRWDFGTAFDSGRRALAFYEGPDYASFEILCPDRGGIKIWTAYILEARLLPSEKVSIHFVFSTKVARGMVPGIIIPTVWQSVELSPWRPKRSLFKRLFERVPKWWK